MSISLIYITNNNTEQDAIKLIAHYSNLIDLLSNHNVNSFCNYIFTIDECLLYKKYGAYDNQTNILEILTNYLKKYNMTNVIYNDITYNLEKYDNNGLIFMALVMQCLNIKGIIFINKQLPSIYISSTASELFEHIRLFKHLDKKYLDIYDNIFPYDSKQLYMNTLLELIKYRELGTVEELIDKDCRLNILLHAQELNLPFN
jgi:hypothetical protein